MPPPIASTPARPCSARALHPAFRLLLLILIALPGLLSLQAPARDRDDFSGGPPAPLPEPNPLVLQVARGETVRITLSAYSLTSPIVRYRIRRPPDGRIGTPRMLDETNGVVEYRPPPGSGPGEDSFEYSVQSLAGVSAPAEVRITITDTDALLSVPEELDFGDVPTGETASRLLVIQNIGGGLAQGDVKVPDPWSVDGSPDYRLRAGEKASFTIRFTPRELGGHTGDVEYPGNPGKATDLKGRVVPPVSVTQGPVELLQAGPERSCTIEVQNRTAAPLAFHVAPGPHVAALPDSLTVAPESIGQVEIREKPGQPESIHDLVTVEGGGLRVEVPVYVPAPPAPPQAAASPGIALAQAPPPPAAAPAVRLKLADAAAPAPLLPPLPQPGQAATPAASPTLYMPAFILDPTGPAGTRGSCTFPFPASSYRVEEQTLTLDSQGNPVTRWEPLVGATVSSTGVAVVAAMPPLPPGSNVMVRLAGLDQQGDVAEFSGPALLFVPPLQPGHGTHWIVGALCILLVALLAQRFVARRKLGRP